MSAPSAAPQQPLPAAGTGAAGGVRTEAGDFVEELSTDGFTDQVEAPLDDGDVGDASGESWGLTRGDRTAAWAIALLVLGLAGIHYLSLWRGGLQPVHVEHLVPREEEFVVDVNSAHWAEIAQLDGIGDKLAHKIVESREQDGPFRNAEDLLRVRGIGRKTLEKFRHHVVCGPGPASATQSDTSASDPPQSP